MCNLFFNSNAYGLIFVGVQDFSQFFFTTDFPLASTLSVPEVVYPGMIPSLNLEPSPNFPLASTLSVPKVVYPGMIPSLNLEPSAKFPLASTLSVPKVVYP